jgi:hypothetical protein
VAKIAKTTPCTVAKSRWRNAFFLAHGGLASGGDAVDSSGKTGVVCQLRKISFGPRRLPGIGRSSRAGLRVMSVARPRSRPGWRGLQQAAAANVELS